MLRRCLPSHNGIVRSRVTHHSQIPNTSHVAVSESAATIAKDDSQLSKLVTMVTGIAEKQQSIENRFAKAERSSAETTQNERRERATRLFPTPTTTTSI